MASNYLPVIPGGYVPVKLLGRGGFGEVWEAVAPGGFRVAVKIINRPADHEERLREERALGVIKGLKHHFLIKTHATYSEEEHLFIIMDLADGGLRERVKECRKTKTTIPLPEILFYSKEAAEALDYMHEKDVLHRDIKPDNILLVDNHVRLADFGLARHQEQLLASVSGSGTMAYMAPEVWRGKASRASDLYSFAYTYAELRLGHRPFTGTEMGEIMFAHLDHTPNLDPLPEPEQRVLLVALAKQPEARYPTCMALVQGLELATGLPAARFPCAAGSQGVTGTATSPHAPDNRSGIQKIVAAPLPPGKPEPGPIEPFPNANIGSQISNIGSLVPQLQLRPALTRPSTPLPASKPIELRARPASVTPPKRPWKVEDAGPSMLDALVTLVRWLLGCVIPCLTGKRLCRSVKAKRRQALPARHLRPVQRNPVRAAKRSKIIIAVMKDDSCVKEVRVRIE